MITATLRTGYTSHPAEAISIWSGSRAPGGIPLILCHGFLGSASQWYDTSITNLVAPTAAEAGVTALGSDLGGGNTWGNDTFLTAFDDTVAYGAATYGTRTDQVGIWAGSMGGQTLNWVWRNPDKVAGCALTIPSVDLMGIWEQNPIGLAPFIDLAYTDHAGLLAALPGHDPSHQDNIAKLVPINHKIRIWYSLNDNVIDRRHVERFAARTGIETTSMGNVGHSIGTDPAVGLDWLLPRLRPAGANLLVRGNVTVRGNVVRAA